MSARKKIIRTATVPISLDLFCRGLLRELSSEYDVIALSSPLPELDGIREREGVRTIAVQMQRKIAPFRDLGSLFRLVSVFRKEKPDMVHSITPKAGLLSMIAAWIARAPVRVHTFTGLIFPYEKGLKRLLLLMTDRITAACATNIIPEGKGVKEDLIRYKVTRKPLRVLGKGNIRGLDLKYFSRKQHIISIRQELGIGPDAFVFVYVGRLDRDKGIDELVRAFLRLEKERPYIRLLLVGEAEADGNPLPESTWEMIRQSDHIYLADGWQEDVRPWYAAADALVHPSYREGFPNVVIEAGAMELSAIVTDVNGSREIIRDGKNGTIIPAKDADALYEAMKTFADRPDLVRQMAQRARPMVANRYEQGYVRHCLVTFYREVLK